MVFQDPLTSLNPTISIGDQVGEPLRIHRGLSRRDARSEAAKMLDLVQVPRAVEPLGEYPHQLSGGLRQRVAIAAALILRPKLLIADEPTTALDVTIQAQILSLIAQLQRDLGLAVLMISHNMGVIANYTDRVAVMYAGRIVEVGATAALVSRPRHPYTSALLDAVPQLGRRRDERLDAIPGAPPDLAELTRGRRFAPRCRFAQVDCRQEEPGLDEGEPGHAWACHYPIRGERVAWRSHRELRGPVDQGPSASSRAGLSSEISGQEALYELRHITKHYAVSTGGLRRATVGAVHALDDVTLAVRPGFTFGLVGESGCGKSTLAEASGIGRHVLAFLQVRVGI